MYNINEITKFIIIGIILLICFKKTNLNKDKSKGNSHFPYNESNLINSSYNLNMNKKIIITQLYTQIIQNLLSIYQYILIKIF